MMRSPHAYPGHSTCHIPRRRAGKFFHQVAICGHELGHVRRTEPAVGCTLLSGGSSSSLCRTSLNHVRWW